MQSYIEERSFKIKQEDEYYDLRKVQAGVPQGSVPLSILYFLYSGDLLKFEWNIVDTFVDDIAILAIDDDDMKSVEKIINCYHQNTKLTNDELDSMRLNLSIYEWSLSTNECSTNQCTFKIK